MKAFFINIFCLSIIFSQCDENYVENPLFSEGEDDHEQCIPEEFVFYISTTFSAYMFNVVLINDNEISSDDWVGAFNDSNNDGIGDICVGSRKWDVNNCGDSTCDVMVRGDDGSDLTDGYMFFGEYPYFKIFDASTGQYLNATPQYNVAFGNLGATVIGYLQACSGGPMDLDNDNICNDVDPCPNDPLNLDSDNDGSCDSEDLCFGDDSSGDYDNDGICNSADEDDDNDGVGDSVDQCSEGALGWTSVEGAAIEDYGLVSDYDADGCQDSIEDNDDDNDNVIDDDDLYPGCNDFDSNCMLNAEGPNIFLLKQNYPNPFNPFTTIEFIVEENDYIDLIIYDLNGKKVKHLVNEFLLKGLHTIKWDGKNDNNKALPSSIYIVYLKNSKDSYYNKLTLIK